MRQNLFEDLIWQTGKKASSYTMGLDFKLRCFQL